MERSQRLKLAGKRGIFDINEGVAIIKGEVFAMAPVRLFGLTSASGSEAEGNSQAEGKNKQACYKRSVRVQGLVDLPPPPLPASLKFSLTGEKKYNFRGNFSSPRRANTKRRRSVVYLTLATTQLFVILTFEKNFRTLERRRRAGLMPLRCRHFDMDLSDASVLRSESVSVISLHWPAKSATGNEGI